jgi:hypothetical protein
VCHYVGTTDAELETLYAVVWLDGKSRGLFSPKVDSAPASELRCRRTGPDTAYNYARWCCR